MLPEKPGESDTDDEADHPPNYSFWYKPGINWIGFFPPEFLCFKLAGPENRETRLEGRRNTFGPWTPPSVYVRMNTAGRQVLCFSVVLNRKDQKQNAEAEVLGRHRAGNLLSRPEGHVRAPFPFHISWSSCLIVTSQCVKNLSQENMEIIQEARKGL